jgi:lysophospholipid acyltransferase (LPLAT)-like uncharacterized protein
MSELKFDLAGVVGSGVVTALLATTRVQRVGDEHYLRFRREARPVVFVFWHAEMLPLIRLHRNEGAVVLVSEHADGEYMTRILHRQGFRTIRGSSTRGATAALKGLIREARAGRDIAVTPDGPRGPAREFKVGALAVAQSTGLPIIPVAVDASPSWHLGSWDRFLVPRPFARVRVAYGAPRWVPRDADRTVLERMAAELGRAMDDLGGAARLEDGR